MSGSFRLLVTLGAVVLVAWVAGSAGARQLAGIYNVHPLVSDSAAVQAAGRRCVSGQRVGVECRPDDAVVDFEQRVQHVDLVQRGRSEVGTDGDGCGSTHRHGVQRQCHGFRRQPKRQERRGAVPVRNGGRHHHGVVAWSQRDSRSDGRRPLRGWSSLQGPRDRKREVVRIGLPQRACRRVRQVVQPRVGRFHGSEDPNRLRTVRIQALAGNIFVTYAKQDTAKKDDVAEPGQGYVDEFTPDGALVAQVVNSGKKNAPLNAAWGLALAPTDFGAFAGDLLVGNFGNGRISAYSKRDTKWVYRGQLRLADGTPIAIDGLWAIAFGNGAAAGPTTTPLLPRRAERRKPRPLRIDHHRLSRTAGSVQHGRNARRGARACPR